jgi:hypothetical protein
MNIITDAEIDALIDGAKKAAYREVVLTPRLDKAPRKVVLKPWFDKGSSSRSPAFTAAVPMTADKVAELKLKLLKIRLLQMS